jgi:type I restriction enzyme S subunit
MPTVQDGVFMITAADINDGRLQLETARKTSESAYRTLLTAKSKPRQNDILLTKDGTLGRLALVGNETICINQSVAVIRPNERVEPLFLKLLLESPRYQKRMVEDAGGSTIKHIYITIVDKMPVGLPLNKVEQRAIAAALSDVDALLDGLDRLIAKKRDLKQAAMQQLLTGQTRLPGFSGEWEVVCMRSVLVQNATYGIVTTGVFVGNGVKMLRSGDIVDGCINSDLPMVTREKAEEYGRTQLLKQDVVIALVGYPGASARIPDELIGANISRAVGLLRTNKKVAADYLVCFLNSPDGRRMVLAPSAGSAQQVVNLAALNKLEFRIPSRAEQTTIAAVLSDIDAELRALEARRNKTRDLKQAMMQELLTGKTRLVPTGAAHA